MGSLSTDEARTRLSFLPLNKRSNLVKFLKVNLGILPTSVSGKMYLWDDKPIIELHNKHVRLFQTVDQIRSAVGNNNLYHIYELLRYFNDNRSLRLLSIRNSNRDRFQEHISRILNKYAMKLDELMKIIKFLLSSDFLVESEYNPTDLENETLVNRLKTVLDEEGNFVGIKKEVIIYILASRVTNEPRFLLWASGDSEEQLKDNGLMSMYDAEPSRLAFKYVKFRDLYKRQYEITLSGQEFNEVLSEYSVIIRYFSSIGLQFSTTQSHPFLVYM